ncbi:MAG: diguanylate cyclase [Deltaproteobacteria bacterium]|nr:diguanylate cyclase [Deltaproteobacteria bacterium]
MSNPLNDFGRIEHLTQSRMMEFMDNEKIEKKAENGKVRERKKASEFRKIQWRHFLRRLTTVDQWSLRGRFLYLTGVLLVMGSFFQIYCLSSGLKTAIRDRAQEALVASSLSVDRHLQDRQALILSQVAVLASMPEIRSLLAGGMTTELSALAEATADRLGLTLGVGPWNIDFRPLKAPILGPGQNSTVADSLMLMALERNAAQAGLDTLDDRPVLRALAPVGGRHDILGIVEISISLVKVLRDQTAPNTSMLLLTRDDLGGWTVLDGFGVGWDHGRRTIEGGRLPESSEERFYSLKTMTNSAGQEVASLLLGYNASLLEESRINGVYQYGGLFVFGAIVFWAILFFNLKRIEQFILRFKKILIASHASEFKERFETDHVHCLEVLHCHNEECPVYKDPSRVCYLETGSEAISPVWRDTCIFLNRYDTCRNCPVYAMRRGDELSEMRNVVNTMMRLWANFLSRTGHLLAYVLRSQETSGQVPSLDQVSKRLEQMAKLAFFSHDVQGTIDKNEVYAQLAHVFKHDFNLKTFVLFEVDHEADRIVIALDESKEMLCKREVLLSTEVCRANRAAEEVHSFYNPVLCPHFNCDHAQHVRCCLPMVMGGKVGAIFTFLINRNLWERARAEVVPVLRKYLDEAAPVLSSLNLLHLSKEQALRDPLTHIHNRRFLDEFISKYEPLSERNGRSTGLLMADLDYFKQVNDEFGHEVGDQVLKDVVTLMSESIRRSDLLVRYGGEEFLVLLQDVQPGAAVEVAEKIRAVVEQHAFVVGEGKVIHKTISLGVAEYPEDGNTMYKAIKFADVALYEAKNQGRNRVVRFKPEMWQSDQY